MKQGNKRLSGLGLAALVIAPLARGAAEIPVQVYGRMNIHLAAALEGGRRPREKAQKPIRIRPQAKRSVKAPPVNPVKTNMTTVLKNTGAISGAVIGGTAGAAFLGWIFYDLANNPFDFHVREFHAIKGGIIGALVGGGFGALALGALGAGIGYLIDKI